MAEITATPHHPGIASSSTASCSASALTPYVHYDIFVIHFENETRDFAIALCGRLTNRGLCVFLNELDFSDQEEFQSGMEDAISLASLQIAIFSPNYAQWEWSMDTLVKMTKSDVPILPVFYKVEPFHLRFTSKDDKGPYAQSLRDHEEKERYGSQTIQAWRDALFHVSNLSGLPLWSDGAQEVLVGKVVDRVFKDYCRPRDYHVFLSHRGPDTKEKFAEPLYNLLLSSGLRVFLDKEEMVGALKIDAQIEVAIQFAHVNIVIFSPRFPESSWCMDELSLMTKIEGKILPVFYEVEPSHLDGVYIETLYCHHRERQREDRETIEKWKDALAKVPKSDEFMLAGEELKEELKEKLKEELKEKLKEELMHKIVERVRKHIAEPAPSEVMRSSEEHRAAKSVLNDGSKRSEVVPVEDFYIGLPEKLEDFEKAVLSQQEEKRVEAKVVGIVGGVGIGKTALAKEIFKRKTSNYCKSSCLFNVRNYVARKYALKDLQSMIIKNLKHSLGKEIESVEEGKEILQQHLRSCQALVILDDVDHVDQLYALTPILHPNSLILVTSRNKDVLNKFGIVDSSIYHLAGLNREDSRKLLLSYAFNPPNQRPPSIYHLLGKDFQNLLLSYDSDHPFPRDPSEDPLFKSLVKKFIKACDGLPEPLKELGESLRGKDRSGWEDQLNQLRHNCKLFIETKLNICYDSLNKEEQQIFLDVACFFIGEDRYSVTRIFGMERLQKLEKRCLLKVTSKIEMNEFLRNYGKNKANRLTPRRLWHQGTKQINYLLENSPSELAHFRGITMNGNPGDETEMPCCKQSGETFSSSRNLKFLAAQGGYVEKILTRVGSADLLWLKWHKCTHSSLPPWISMEKLRVLEVDGSKLTELWQTESQVPLQLRELIIRAPLSRFPQSIGQLKLLEKIVVKCSGPEEFCRPECSGMMSLPDSFGDLANLQYLYLTGASCLQMLPESFGNLTVLKYLSLEGCSQIRKLPGLEHFTSLETLDVRGCKNLESIPELGQLIKLQILDVSGCSQIKCLSGLEHLNSLEKFNVSGCQKLQSIPGLGQLTKLPELNVSGCSEIKSLRGLENLTSLESFNVSGCQKLESIPGLGKLTKLQTLDVSGCSEIQKLPGLEHLTSLKTFNVRGCEKLQSIDVSGSRGIHTLSGLEHLTSLKKLNVSGCCEIQSLLRLKHLTSLKTLNVSGCKKLQSIRGLGQLRKLQTLNVSRCYEIRELPGVELLTSLERLNISECKKLQRIRPLGQLRNIRALDVGGCQIQWLSGLKYLSSLKKLNIRECEKLHRILGLGQLTKLQILNVSGCCKIRELPGVERLTSLKTLNVSKCRDLESIPELGKLTKLQILNASGCYKIRRLPGVERLTSLKTLNVSGCWNLESMPELGQLTKLQTLDAGGCHEMQSLLGLENLISLKTLNIRECDELHSIPELAQLKKLEILDVGCEKLQRMPSLEHLTSLLTLDITEWRSLESIPTLGSLTKLRNLKLCGLTSLRKLPSLEHLTSLQSLLVDGCESLQSIPSLEHLTNVETLIVTRCGDINSLQGLEHLISLKKLLVCECKKLESMPGLEHLTKLETLDVIGRHHDFPHGEYEHFPSRERETEGGIRTLQGLERLISLKSLNVRDCKELESIPPLNVRDCKELESIPPLRFLQKLKTLDVQRCPKIQDLRVVEYLISLERLNVRDCEELESIPPLRFLQKLKTIHVQGCPKIQDLRGVEHLISLEKLEVSNCEELGSITPLRFLLNLKSLHVLECHKIQDLPGVEHLISLESLEVQGCEELESIPPLRFLQKLKSLVVQGCPKMQDLPGVEHLISLESLIVTDCKELESIPPLRFLQKLKSLHVQLCPKMQDLRGMEHLISLESLHVWDCKELGSITPLRFLQKLKSLFVTGCHKIQDLPGVEHLISLESLYISHCKELQSIPPLRFLQKLKSLYVTECPKIQDLPGVESAMSLETIAVRECPSFRWDRGLVKQLRQRKIRLYGDAFRGSDSD